MEFCKISFGFVLKIIFMLSIVGATTLDSDIQALILVKKGVDAASIGTTTCLGSWDFSVDPCDFRSTRQFVCGIRCDVKTREGKSRVTSLALDRVGYKGYLHPAIGNLTELTELDVSGNAFHGSIPESIAGLSKLTRLDLSENMLSGPLPLSLGKLGSLQVLSISGNMVSGSVPASLNNLKNLMRLDLSHNGLGGVIPPLGGMISLYNLDLSFNRLVGGIPSQLPRSLSQLTLKSNLLSGSLPLSLSSLSELGVLDLSINRLSGAIDGSLFAHPSLQQLNLSNNSFSAISVVNVSGMGSQLVAIDIGFNRITGVLPPNFSTLDSLAALYLRYNQFQGSIPVEYGVKAMNSSRPLVRLFLDGNYLTGEFHLIFLGFLLTKLVGALPITVSRAAPLVSCSVRGLKSLLLFARVHTEGASCE